jgi:hypothetical protein
VRSIGPAGWASHGFFGFKAKTFGNPTGATSGDGGVTPPGGPEPAFADSLAFGNGGYMLTGFFGVLSSTQFTAVRFNTVFDDLATQADDPVGNLANGVNLVFFAAGNFVGVDGNQTIANDAGDGTAWALAINPDGAAVNGPYAIAFDLLHGKFLIGDQNSTNIYASNNTTPLTLGAEATGATFPIACIGTKGNTGITLAIEQGGGAIPQVWKSTDGETWAAVASAPFVGNAGFFVGFGETRWLALGGEASTGVLQFATSTDDGSTWTAAADLPGSVPSGAGAPGGVATSNGGVWVVFNNASQGAPAAYWVSSDDGQTWTAPGTFTQQSASFGILWDGAQFVGLFLDPTETFSFLATSPTGETWTVGPTVMEPT